MQVQVGMGGHPPAKPHQHGVGAATRGDAGVASLSLGEDRRSALNCILLTVADAPRVGTVESHHLHHHLPPRHPVSAVGGCGNPALWLQ